MIRNEEAIKYLENSMAIGNDDASRQHNEMMEFLIEALKGCEDTDQLKAENKELKKILDANIQKNEKYRDFIKLIGNMKACERFIDKEKAFDEIIKSLPDDKKEAEE